MNRLKNKRKHQDRCISIPTLAYLLRLGVVAVYWGAYGPEIVTAAILCQVLCDILNQFVDSEIVEPLLRKLYHYVLRKWQGLKRLFSKVHIEIRISINIGEAE